MDAAMTKSKARGFSLFLAGLLGAFVIDHFHLDDLTDYEQAVAYEAYYCGMVEKNLWPATSDHPCPNYVVEPGAKLASF